jgi:hypothetical protein
VLALLAAACGSDHVVARADAPAIDAPAIDARPPLDAPATDAPPANARLLYLSGINGSESNLQLIASSTPPHPF